MRHRSPLTTKLFNRHEDEPILSAADWPYAVNSVFNPGAVLLKDGTTLLLCRVEDHRGHSHLCAARSSNGFDGWQIDPSPTFMPDPVNFPEELWGVEDPRLTFVPELDQYVIAYTAYSHGGPSVALATTEDFRQFHRMGSVMPPDDKDAALLPCRVNGRWALVHRPSGPMGSDIWVSYSPDLKHWGDHRMLLVARRGAWWDANKIGLSPPLVETSRGWLMIYHGVRQHASGSLYRIGLALFDHDDPEKCLRRSTEWVFGPATDCERAGDVSNVVFPCGVTQNPDDRNELRMYYGAADTCIAVATADLDLLLDWLDDHSSLAIE